MRSTTARRERLVGRLGGALAALLESGEVLRLVGPRAPRELGEQRVEAGPELKRRLPGMALVEVGARSQEQRLADVDRLPTGEHRRQALLRAQRLGAALAAPGLGDLHGLLPAPRREPVAGAVPDPGDENRLAPDLVTVGIVSGDPVGAQHRVDRPQPAVTRASAASGSPAVRWSSRAAAAWLGGLGGDHGEAGEGHLGGVLAGLGRARSAPARPAAAGCHAPSVCTTTTASARSSIGAAQQVAPVIEPEVAGDV